MQRSDREVGREDGLDRWGECVDRTCVGRRWGECVDGQPVPENSPWVCVWLGDRSGWTGDRLAELDRVRWSRLMWVWALTHRGSAAFGAVIVWLNSASPAWGRSMSVARSEQWVLSLTCLLDWSSRWLDRSSRWELSVAGSEVWFFLSLVGWVEGCVLSLALSAFSFSRSLCVGLCFGLSLRSFSHSLCVVLSLVLSAFFLSDSVFCVTRKWFEVKMRV